MRVGDGEEDLYIVFSLSHLSPAFCALVFGYVLSLAVFLAEIFVTLVVKRQNCEVDWGYKETSIGTQNNSVAYKSKYS